jgi:hypothetical protein
MLLSGYYYNQGHTEANLVGDVFIEYSYVLNFVDDSFECYSGGYGLFQKIPLAEINHSTTIKED